MYYIMTQTRTHMHKCTLDIIYMYRHKYTHTYTHSDRQTDTCTDR